MTATAYVGYLFKTGRGCSVGAVTGSAVGGAEVLLIKHSVAVDALFIEIKLVCGDFMSKFVLARYKAVVDCLRTIWG